MEGLKHIYLLVLLVGFWAGAMFSFRILREEDIKTRSEKIQFVAYGVSSSMFVTWIGFETFAYLGLPTALSCALGGGLGFIGAETIARIVILTFKKKAGAQDDKDI